MPFYHAPGTGRICVESVRRTHSTPGRRQIDIISAGCATAIHRDMVDDWPAAPSYTRRHTHATSTTGHDELLPGIPNSRRYLQQIMILFESLVNVTNMRQGQRQAMFSPCPKFHPNRFTSGGVIAERVNTIETHHKVLPIFGRSLASSRIIIGLQSLLIIDRPQ